MSKVHIDITQESVWDIVVPRTALTLRIDASERDALRSLSKVEGRPINQLLIEAIRSTSDRRAAGSARSKRI